MKNKIQKNNEKNLDQNTRSLSIKSTWAVRLFVLLVMLTTILASFVVPASAADPFQGSLTFNILYPPSFIQIGGSYFDTLPLGYSNGVIADTRLSNGVYYIDRATGVSGNLQTHFVYNTPQTLDNIVIESASYSSSVAFSNGESVSIPANSNFIDYITEFNPELIEVSVRSVVITQNPFNGLQLVLNSNAYSVDYEGGIQSVFDLIGSWLSNTFNTLGGVFFDNGSLTVLGGLAIGSLGVSVILLLIKVISNFIRFRG